MKGDGKALASGGTSLRWKKNGYLCQSCWVMWQWLEYWWSKENDGKHAAALSLKLEISPMATKRRRF